MKKFFKTLLPLLLTLPVLVACGDDDPRPVEEIVEDNALTALGQVNIICNTWSQSAGLSKDTELKTSVTVDGYVYSVDYALTSNYNYTTAWAKIEGTTLKIKVPENTQLPAEANEYASYKLNGKIKFAGMAEGVKGKKGYQDLVGNQYAEGNWNIRINATITLELSAAELYTNESLKSGKTRVISYGIFAGSDTEKTVGFAGAASNKYSLYFDDGDYTFVAYDQSWTAYPTDLVIGQVYKVTGTYSNYYNTIEIAAPVIEAAPTHQCTPSNTLTISGSGAADVIADTNHASHKCNVTGVITKIEKGYTWGWLWALDNPDGSGNYSGNKFSIYVNITGATETDGITLKSEAYAYVHGFDDEISYKSWAQVDVGTTETTGSFTSTSIGATINFTGRAYWYSGYPTFYAATLNSYTAA